MIVISILSAYLIGAIPTGAWISRLFTSKDITQHGSGNIGATNVARLMGARWFLVVFALDMAKAYCVMRYLCGYDASQYTIVAIAAALLIGNSYSIFLAGKGGKGISTACGIIAFYSWQFLAILIAAWAIVLAITRNVGISSVIACIAALCGCFIMHCSCFDCSLIIFISVWCIWRHVKNIQDYLSYLAR
jgi:acyl phosphate:glycerol-3-phosphate acyltransferase